MRNADLPEMASLLAAPWEGVRPARVGERLGRGLANLPKTGDGNVLPFPTEQDKRRQQAFEDDE